MAYPVPETELGLFARVVQCVILDRSDRQAGAAAAALKDVGAPRDKQAVAMRHATQPVAGSAIHVASSRKADPAEAFALAKAVRDAAKSGLNLLGARQAGAEPLAQVTDMQRSGALGLAAGQAACATWRAAPFAASWATLAASRPLHPRPAPRPKSAPALAPSSPAMPIRLRSATPASFLHAATASSQGPAPMPEINLSPQQAGQASALRAGGASKGEAQGWQEALDGVQAKHGGAATGAAAPGPDAVLGFLGRLAPQSSRPQPPGLAPAQTEAVSNLVAGFRAGRHTPARLQPDTPGPPIQQPATPIPGQGPAQLTGSGAAAPSDSLAETSPEVTPGQAGGAGAKVVVGVLSVRDAETRQALVDLRKAYGKEKARPF